MVLGPDSKKLPQVTINSIITPLSLNCVATIFFNVSSQLNKVCNWGGTDGYDSLESYRINYLEVIVNYLTIINVSTNSSQFLAINELAQNLKSVDRQKVSDAVYQLLEWSVFNDMAVSKKSPAQDRLQKICNFVHQLLTALSEHAEASKILIQRMFDIVTEVHSYLMPKIQSNELNFIGINFIYNLFKTLEFVLDHTLKDNHMIVFFIVDCKGINFIFDLLSISYEVAPPEQAESSQSVDPRSKVQSILNNLGQLKMHEYTMETTVIIESNADSKAGGVPGSSLLNNSKP